MKLTITCTVKKKILIKRKKLFYYTEIIYLNTYLMINDRCNYNCLRVEF